MTLARRSISCRRSCETGAAFVWYCSNHSCCRASVRDIRCSGFSSRSRLTKCRPVKGSQRTGDDRSRTIRYTFFAHVETEQRFPFDFALEDFDFDISGIAGFDEWTRARHPGRDTISFRTRNTRSRYSYIENTITPILQLSTTFW